MNIQGWFPLALLGLIFLLSERLSGVFTSITIQKHQFFGSQSSLWSNSHTHTWLLEKPWLWLYRLCWQSNVQFSSVQSLSHVRLFATPWTAARQASLSNTNSWSLLKLMSIQSIMLSNHLILCRLLLLSPSIFPVIRVFSNEPVLHIRWPKYCSFSFNISPTNKYSGLVGSPCSPRDSQESSPTPKFKNINSLVLTFLYSPTLTSKHDYWKNHSLD